MGLGNLIVAIISWTIKIGVAITALSILLPLLAIITQMVYVTLDQTVLLDLFAFLQLWLPFDLNIIFIWFTTVGLLYVLYRMTIWAFNFINSVTGNNI